MAAQVHHPHHRNVIVIPRDIYQKCTEDPIMSRTRMVARGVTTRARNASSQRLWNASTAQNRQDSTTKTKGRHYPARGEQQTVASSRPTNMDLVAAPSSSSSTYSTCMSHVSSPSLCSSLSSSSSYSSSSSSYSSSTSSLENTAPSVCTPALDGNNKYTSQGAGALPHSTVTIGGHITTIHLRNLALLPPKKRKLSAVTTNNYNTVAHATAATNDRNDEASLPSAKRYREDSPSLRIFPSTITNMVRSAMPPREVIVISSDISSDEEEDEDANSHAAVTKPAAAILHTNTTTAAAAAADSSHKYDLEPAHRRIVESIFPQFEEHHKATLERAFATSRVLRENYIVKRYLGSGASGFVLAAKRAFDGREVAIKVIPHTGDHVEQKVQRELSILLKIKEHENILAFLEHFTSSLYGDIDPEDQSNKDISYIVTEMAGFSLFDFIELHKPDQDEDTSTRAKNIQDVPRIDSLPPSIYGSAIQEDALRSIFTQLALALHSLHSQSIVHGDIKDENALISLDRATGTYRAKLCDFGHSKYLQPGSSACFSFYGTTILAPPEMDSNVAARQRSKEANSRRAAAGGSSQNNQTPTWDLFYGFEADVWALGLTLYTMVHGDLPKELYETDKKRLAAYKRKRASHRMFPFTIQDNIDPELKDLLKHMLAVDPSRRLSMSEVVNHPWMVKTSSSS
ncbi:kinase-like protein [Linnemannia elongata AG-77]|uniref:Kinase-like protein n=1 Tax=Linnemannia elongata AG-77 TaxID=1314771 RepID=A0A197K3M9_9FUNG|nr:kinase-like protein [Linnemannia elongata AG-77]